MDRGRSKGSGIIRPGNVAVPGTRKLKNTSSERIESGCSQTVAAGSPGIRWDAKNTVKRPHI